MGKDEDLENGLSEFSLSREAVAELKKIATELGAFEKQKSSIPTASEEVKRLKKIETIAREIGDAFKELSNETFFAFDKHLLISSHSHQLPPSIWGSPGGAVKFMEDVLAHCAEGASGAIKEANDNNSTTGRKKTAKYYAGFIGGVAWALKAEKIKPGRNGSFEKICDLLFSKAGVPSKSEGPIKYFLEHMHKHYQDQGFCL